MSLAFRYLRDIALIAWLRAGELEALETEWRWFHRALTGPVVWNDGIASDSRRVLKRIANQLYRVLVRILAARPRSSAHDAVIVHCLSRLHVAAPPEKLLTTSSWPATNPSRREACAMTLSVSSLRLAPI
jgi:hypothetical protein